MLGESQKSFRGNGEAWPSRIFIISVRTLRSFQKKSSLGVRLIIYLQKLHNFLKICKSTKKKTPFINILFIINPALSPS